MGGSAFIFYSRGVGYAVFILAVLAVGFAAVNSYFAFDKYSKVSQLTGLTGSEGYVNVTVSSVISVNFTKDSVLWGVGSVTTGQNNASLLLTAGSGTAVTRGNWSTTNVVPLSIENIGSVNVSLKVKSSNNAATLFSGSAGHRTYQVNFTNSDSAACWNDTINLRAWYDANDTDPGTKICSQMGFLDTQDQLNISIWLVVPYDGTTGALTSVLTATVATAG